MSIGHEDLPDDPEALKALLLSARAEATRLTTLNKTLEILVEALKVRIAKLNKQKYGVSSEKLQREIEQLQLTLEDVEIAQAAGDTSDEDESESTPVVSRPAQQRRRGKPRVSPDAPREQVVLDPGEACPSCGGRLELVGEDLSQILEYVAAKLKVVETRSLKKVCRSCNTIHQETAPSRPVRRGMLGASLLAYILVAKFDDHLPLYRQAEIFARLVTWLAPILPFTMEEVWLTRHPDEGSSVHLVDFPATPAAVDRLAETTQWLQWLSVEQRKLVWARARYVPWRAICEAHQCSKPTAWRRWRHAASRWSTW